jgi:hypothetical protein
LRERSRNTTVAKEVRYLLRIRGNDGVTISVGHGDVLLKVNVQRQRCSQTVTKRRVAEGIHAVGPAVPYPCLDARCKRPSGNFDRSKACPAMRSIPALTSDLVVAAEGAAALADVLQ